MLILENNALAGVSVSLGTLILGMFWQYNRVSESGLHGRVVHRESSGYYGGPLLWKLLNQKGGETDVPDTKY